MKTPPSKAARCAIYTRKSTQHGLELEFNSLDAQREACGSYIKSQASLGWKPLATRYDDAAYSGGSLERPALQKLLSDIRTGCIDVIVVYKIDRLTRSLADFAKLVELFETHSVSFVAVTQQFNTTTSMGRLTLNVLLSFAQFERELSSERVRDKVAASRKKGKWMGGHTPFGYRSQDKKLIVDPNEAKTIRHVFKRYLELKSIEKLVETLKTEKLTTRKRSVGDGRESGGVSFGFGTLAYLLKNQIYIGKVNHKGAWFIGEHKPIVDRNIFNAVQKLLKYNSIVRWRKRAKSGALLTGILFDDRGNRMSPSYTTKKGVRYRFYVNSALITGKAALAGSVRRISALSIERDVLSALQTHLPKNIDRTGDRNLVESFVARVTIRTTKTEIELKALAVALTGKSKLEISTPVKNKPNERIEGSGDASDQRLIDAIVKAHLMMKMLLDGRSIQAVSRKTQTHPRAVQSGGRLAFLHPDIAAAIFRKKKFFIPNLVKFHNSLPLSWQKQQHLLKRI